MDDETTVGNSSSSSGDGQSSGDGSQQSVDLNALNRKVDELAAMFRGIQKGTDKVNARVEQRVEGLASQVGRIAELVKAGKTPGEIENQLILDEILAERKGRPSGGGDGNPPAGGGGEVQTIIKGLADEFGLDANDKAVAEALSRNDVSALARIAKARLSVPAPDGSDAPPITSKSPAPNKAEEIERGYLAEIATVRGNPHKAAMVKSKWRQKAREAGFVLNV